MKEVSQMTAYEVATAFCVVMDTVEQEKLMNNPEDPNSWMLDFVYDAESLRELEEHFLKLNKKK